VAFTGERFRHGPFYLDLERKPVFTGAVETAAMSRIEVIERKAELLASHPQNRRAQMFLETRRHDAVEERDALVLGFRLGVPHLSSGVSGKAADLPFLF
jgi:hypothetical protein